MSDSVHNIQTVHEPGGENTPGSNYFAESRLSSISPNSVSLKRRRAIEKSVARLLASPGLIADKFSGLVDRLSPEFKLIRAGLLLKSHRSNELVSSVIWDEGVLLSEVSVRIPSKESILMELLETDCAKVISPAACFLGNFVESRLFVSDPAGSLSIFPLCLDENRLGLVILNSTDAESFYRSARWISNQMEMLAVFLANGINSDAVLSA